MTTAPSNDLPATLMQLAETLEREARDIAAGARKSAETWKPRNVRTPRETTTRTERLIGSLTADEAVATVDLLRVRFDDAPSGSARTLGTLLRLAPDRLTATIVDAVAAPGEECVDDALAAAGLDALFIEDVLRLHDAIQTVRGAELLFDPPPTPPGAAKPDPADRTADAPPPLGATFDDLGRLSDYSIQLMLRRIKPDALATAMIDAPERTAARLAANQTRSARRIFAEAVEAARFRADPESVREARRIVAVWLTDAIDKHIVDFEEDGR